jgi:hypothetical protein
MATGTQFAKSGGAWKSVAAHFVKFQGAWVSVGGGAASWPAPVVTGVHVGSPAWVTVSNPGAPNLTAMTGSTWNLLDWNATNTRYEGYLPAMPDRCYFMGPYTTGPFTPVALALFAPDGGLPDPLAFTFGPPALEGTVPDTLEGGL